MPPPPPPPNVSPSASSSSSPANATAPPPVYHSKSSPPERNSTAPPPASTIAAPSPSTNITAPPPPTRVSPVIAKPPPSPPNATPPTKPPSASPTRPTMPPPGNKPPPENSAGSPSAHAGKISPPSSVPDRPSTPSHPSSSGHSRPPASESVSRHPPTSDSSSHSTTSPSFNLSAGLVIGIAVAALLILLVLSCLIFLCCKKKKRRNTVSSDYYAPPPQLAPKDDSYIPPQQRWHENAFPSSDHTVSMMPHARSPQYWNPNGTQHSDYAVSVMPAMASQTAQSPSPPISSSEGSGSNYSGYDAPLLSKSTFYYEELVLATNGFSDANLLGQGGFGFVHKGVLPNGKEIAVKQLKTGSGQGEREFQAEIDIISRVHHRHLVSLVGYCVTGSRRLLIYEFVPNKTLEFHLHGKGRPTMDWPTRLKIALGSAKGLAYLHEDCHPKIIHRDVKATNILLDFKFEAKVADFGLAKFSSDLNTHVSTRVMGTFGYMAPEYASSGKLTEKSDVFSFGVMLLELITGRRPVDSNNASSDESLVDWARPLLTQALEDENFDVIVDPRIRNGYDPEEMARVFACAAGCVWPSARHRPRMSQIVRALEGDVSLADLHEETRPGQSYTNGLFGSSGYDSNQHNEDMEKFRRMAMTSQQYGSSEYSTGTASEYGKNPSELSCKYPLRTGNLEMWKMKKDGAGFN